MISLNYFWEIFLILNFSPLLVWPTQSYYKENLRFLKMLLTKVSMKSMLVSYSIDKLYPENMFGDKLVRFLRNFLNFQISTISGPKISIFLRFTIFYDFWNRHCHKWTWENVCLAMGNLYPRAEFGDRLVRFLKNFWNSCSEFSTTSGAAKPIFFLKKIYDI